MTSDTAHQPTLIWRGCPRGTHTQEQDQLRCGWALLKHLCWGSSRLPGPRRRLLQVLQGPPGSGHVLVAWLWPRAAGGWGGPEEQPEAQPLSAVLYSHLLLVIACLLLVPHLVTHTCVSQ